MGFFNDLFGDRQGKKAQSEVERLHKEWSEDVATLAKLKEAFIAVQDGEDSEKMAEKIILHAHANRWTHINQLLKRIEYLQLKRERETSEED